MGKRGRPVKSEIRQRIVEILHQIGKAYGYEIHKIYCQIYPKCTREVIYYHLKKGIALEEFEIQEIKQEKGLYSWGGIVEKKYYKLGKQAKPTTDPKVREWVEKNKK